MQFGRRSSYRLEHALYFIKAHAIKAADAPKGFVKTCEQNNSVQRAQSVNTAGLNMGAFAVPDNPLPIPKRGITFDRLVNEAEQVVEEEQAIRSYRMYR